ncbi:glutathione S-transferase [Sulfitobacter sp. D35]|uniref:glutathione S-transferase family protein n=1 Tax=Sulfitobacter sp. D35 TaxID=3083252 RepID=UPI00296F0F6F|nr:glutathione S-transferase [Sulfitobacter sp. D35]MDW4498677.1 glutathione S-transferase [Sulfitobacter sp. D35]
MIFYDCATAPSPRRARMFIAEKGLEPERRDISIAQNQQLAPEFLAVNPQGTLPVLVTQKGLVLTENLAIAAYLEAIHPDPPLMGESATEKAEILQWSAICETRGGAPIAEVLRNSHPAMKGRALPGPQDVEQIPQLAERGRTRVTAFFDLLEQRLADRRYLGGARFSLADITGFVFVDFARVIRTRIPEKNTATSDWYDRIAARPSAAL